MMLLLAYLVLITVAALRRNGEQVLTGAVLLTNYAVNTLFVYATGEGLPWLTFITVDYLSALTIWFGRSTRWETALIGSYVMEMIAHAAFGCSGGTPRAAWNYYWTLDYIAWGQIALVGSWVVYDFARYRFGARGCVPSDVANGEKAS